MHDGIKALRRNTMMASRTPTDTEGWGIPKPEFIPRPTYYPITFALAAVLTLFGIIILWPMTIVGIVLLVISLIGWIGEMRHDQRKQA